MKQERLKCARDALRMKQREIFESLQNGCPFEH